MKNGRWGVVPVSTFAADLLRRRAARMEGDWLFPSPKLPDAPYGSIKTAWGRLTSLTGLDWMQVYDLRHFYASELSRLGATEQQVGRLLCHVGQSVTSRYVHHDLDALRPFVEGLSEDCVRAAEGVGARACYALSSVRRGRLSQACPQFTRTSESP